MRVEDYVLSRKHQFKIMMYALIIGVIAGLLSTIFHVLVREGTKLAKMITAYGTDASLAFLLPLVVYLILYLSNQYYLKENRAFGVRAVDRELRCLDSHLMRPIAICIKLFNTIVALSCGMAVGQFGPTIHIGGAIGSNIGYHFNMHKNVIRVLIGCGVAGAISAVMRWPLFATIFVVEVIFSKRYFDYMMPVLLSSLVAYGLDRHIVGDYSILNLSNVTAFPTLDFKIWLMISALAIGVGILAAIYVLLLKWSQRRLQKYCNHIGFYLIVTMLMSGIYYLLPLTQYMHVENIIPTKVEWVIMGMPIFYLLIISVRLCLTSFQLGSGVYGGNFSPGLILGVIYGALFFECLSPYHLHTLNFYHIVVLSVLGMLSGFAHAPVSAVILALETTGEMTFLIPALIVALLSYFISYFIAKESVYNL